MRESMPKPPPQVNAPEPSVGGASPRPLPQPPDWHGPPPPAGLARGSTGPALFGGSVIAVVVACVAILVLRPAAAPEDLTLSELQALQHAEAARRPPVEAPPPRPALPATPELHLRSRPAGAAVWLNGEPAGYTPIRLRQLPAGVYAVSVQRPAYVSLDTTVFLSSGSTVAMEVTLEEARRVEVAAAEAPAAPAPRRRPRAVRASSPRPSDSRPDPGARSPLTFGGLREASAATVRRVQHTGSLYVVSEPTGAEVYVNGTLRGRAPLVLSGLRPGAYTVMLQLADYARASRQVRVSAGAVDVIRGTLRRAPAAR